MQQRVLQELQVLQVQELLQLPELPARQVPHPVPLQERQQVLPGPERAAGPSVLRTRPASATCRP